MADAATLPVLDATLAVPVSSDDHTAGPASAPVTLVEYGDYECPSCLNAQPIVSELRSRFGESLRFVFPAFPGSAPSTRTPAPRPSRPEAAAAQGKFWEMHESLFRHQSELAELDLTHLALRVGLEVYGFQRAAESDVRARKVRSDYEGGVRSGVRGTPTFFINGRRYARASRPSTPWPKAHRSARWANRRASREALTHAHLQ